MTAQLTPAMQHLLDTQAEAFAADARIKLAEMKPTEFHRWVADRMFSDATAFANAKRRETEREAFYADPEIWDTEFDDPMAVSEAIEMQKCGRCGQMVDSILISVTGPYSTCPTCTRIIRN